MKTILHLIDTTGPGGAETVFIDLASRLPKDRFRSVVVIQGDGWVHDELVRRDIKPVLLNCKGSFNWRFLLKLRQLIRREKVDLIQSHLLGSNVYASLAGLITGIPVIATFHGAVDIGENERMKGLKFSAINHGCSQVVAVSDNLRQDVIRRSPVRAEKISVIYNGIATSEFQIPHHEAIRQRFGWLNDEIVVGSLGNIRPAKGYDVLLQAAKIVKEKSLPFRFVVAGQGKGTLYENLLKTRADSGLEGHVQFLGFNNDPADFLANLDFFLLSSVTEGFSIATIQAMASNLPVIVTKSGGPEEIVKHAENGWLVEPADPVAIVEALVSLSENRELCENIRQNGFRHVRKLFDIESMLNAYQAIYEKWV